VTAAETKKVLQALYTAAVVCQLVDDMYSVGKQWPSVQMQLRALIQQLQALSKGGHHARR